MQIRQNISLKQYNTFGIDVPARYFATFSDTTTLSELLTKNLKPRTQNPELKTQNSELILGGGSNILLTQPFNRLVLKNEITGIKLIKEDDRHIYIQAGAGENWHQFVS